MTGKLRSLEEIEHAHDFVRALLTQTTFVEQVNRADAQSMRTAHAVLCWVLGHQFDPDFGEMLAGMERGFAAEGIVLRGVS